MYRVYPERRQFQKYNNYWVGLAVTWWFEPTLVCLTKNLASIADISPLLKYIFFLSHLIIKDVSAWMLISILANGCHVGIKSHLLCPQWIRGLSSTQPGLTNSAHKVNDFEPCFFCDKGDSGFLRALIQEIFNKYFTHQDEVISGYWIRQWCKILGPVRPRVSLFEKNETQDQTGPKIFHHRLIQ